MSVLLTLRYALQSHAGGRGDNEDAACAGPRLLALADGVGGHAAGEIAASVAINHAAPLNDAASGGDLLLELRRVFAAANWAIRRRISEDPAVAGMATTLTALLFDGRRVGLGHIGDSRAYLLREGSLTQITQDDTFVQSLVADGRLSPDQAFAHPQRNIVTQVLTGDPIQPHFEIREVNPGDRYLLCSDGLSDYVPSEAIAEGLRSPDPQGCPQELIRLAMRAGTRDNVTCIVGDVVEGPSGYNIAITVGAAGKSATVVSV